LRRRDIPVADMQAQLAERQRDGGRTVVTVTNLDATATAVWTLTG